MFLLLYLPSLYICTYYFETFLCLLIYIYIRIYIYIYRFIYLYLFIEGSLEVKLPTIWRDEKQSRAEAQRRGRLEERRSEEKE